MPVEMAETNQSAVQTRDMRGQPTGSAAQSLYALLGRYALVFILIGLVAAFSIARPDSFFTARNFEAIIVNQIVVVFAAIGLVAPLMVGELDLSVGYLVGFAQALVIGLMTLQGLPIHWAILVTLAACAFVGAINAVLVVKVGINSLIATLATGTVLYGLVLWYTQGTVLFQGVPKEFLSISNGRFLGLPLPVVYAAILVALVEFTMRLLPTGRRVMAVGGNRRAATLTGIRVNTIIVGAFVFTGFCCAIGGVIIASRLGSAQPELGPQYLLPAYSAAFLGATTVQPGRFNALGTVVAVYLMAVIVAGLQQIGVPFWAEYIVYGLALASGVALAQHLTRLRDARARRDQLNAIEESR
jgi:ribose transport system permease protein